MATIGIIASIAVSAVAIIYGLILARKVDRSPEGSKKMIDAAKKVAQVLKSKRSKNIKDFSLVSVVLATAILYAFGWQMATCFVIGAAVFMLTDYFLLDFWTEVPSRLIEQSRSDIVAGHKLNMNFSLPTTYLSLGVSLLVMVAVSQIFRDPICVIVLAMSAILVSIFSWREGRENYFGSYIGVLVFTIALIKVMGAAYPNAEILPLLFSAFILIISILSGIFSWVKSTNPKVFFAILRAMIFVAILALAGAYFGPKYLLEIADGRSLIKSALALGSGVLLGVAVLLVRQLPKVLPTVVVAILILVSSFLVGAFGFALAASGFLSLWPLVTTFGFYTDQIKNTDAIASSVETSSENIKALKPSGFGADKYYIVVLGIFAVGALLVYFTRFSGLNFSLTNIKLISGLLFGGSFVLMLGFDYFANKTLKIASLVVGIVLAGIILGPVFLAGVVVGAVLAEFFAQQTVGSMAVMMATVGVLTSSFIESQYSFLVRMIIAGSILAIVVFYYLFIWLRPKFAKKQV